MQDHAVTPDAETQSDSKPQRNAHGFKFTGDGAEYFRIWIVNIVLTVLTLGIYSAWAKVRNKRYFYGNTHLMGETFEYTAQPLQILKGRLIAAAIVIPLLIWGAFNPIVQIVMGIAFFFLFPWIAVKSLQFNAHYSNYRGVPFSFQGSYGSAIGAFIGWPILGILTFGLLYPFAFYKQQAFKFGGHGYGRSRMKFEATAGDYYKLALILIGLFVLGILAFLAISAVLGAVGAMIVGAADANQDAAAGGLASLGIGIYLLSLVAYFAYFAYAAVYNANLAQNNVLLRKHGFISRWEFFSYFKLLLVNTVLIVLTLGLFYPWAKVRTARYKAEHLLFVQHGELDTFIAEEKEKVAAFGQEMGDVMDLEIAI
ncbi:YjgN family protein [Biformimicrobium ophioploci]|uniref:YjgN family protein n=1 Tax=Biformimicrobium ophioploci TaxID=3036711 RepID=A0ABQ6LWY3_9GAMM|nr:YjgN family protein [Microbulbifer sp. NKW57]GMG86555.1 YjgN family protein [Microbulbifer sp. NKW57]